MTSSIDGVNSYASQMFSRRSSSQPQQPATSAPPPPPPASYPQVRDIDQGRDSRERRDRSPRRDYEREERSRDRRDPGDRRESHRESRDSQRDSHRGSRDSYSRDSHRDSYRDSDRDRDRVGDRDRERDDRHGDRRDYRDSRNARDHRDPRESRDSREYHHGSRDARDYPDSREVRDSRRRRSISPPTSRVKAVPLEERPRQLQNWDAAPPGFEKISADKAKLTGLFPPPGNVAKISNFSASAFDPNKAALLSRLTSGLGSHDSMAAQAAPLGAANRAQRRVYVGGIPMMAGEEELTAFFNQLLGRHSSADPVLTVQIAQDHSYAFVEFRTPEQATQAIELDGTPFHDVTLRIRRPKEYVQHQPDANVPMASAPLHTIPAPSEPNQLVLTGFPRFLGEEHLRQMAAPFGELCYFRLLADPAQEEGRPLNVRSYGMVVLEFADPVDGEGFAATLNQLAMGPAHTLKVQRLEACEGDDEMMQTLSKFGLAPGPLTADYSTVLLLLNAINMDDLSDDDRFANLLEDIQHSMAAYGEIQQIVVPRPIPGSAVAGVGRIFIEYATAEAVQQAMTAVSGKLFAERLVLAVAYPTERFQRRIY